MAFQVSPEFPGYTEEMGPRATKDLWEHPVKWALKGLKEAKGPWAHLERWALKEPRATREKRVPQAWSLRGTGNSASGRN